MTRFMVVIGFLVALAAGFAAGLAWRPPPVSPPEPPPRGNTRGGWIASELNLTDEQRQQMDAIWSSTARQAGRERWSKRDELRKQRDASIQALIPAEQMPQYDKAQADYRAAVDAMEAQWRAEFQQAVQKTREILNEEQRQKYDKIMARHAEGPRGGRGRSGPPGDPATTPPPGPPAPPPPADQP
jgi:Spy/CpxP family protein refolding chaperone